MGAQQPFLGMHGNVPAPVITLFSVNADTPINSGSSVILSYTFSGGTGSIDQGIGSVTSGGTKTVGPLTSSSQTTYTYTLTVTSPSGLTASAQVSVLVVAPPTITSFVANTTYVTNGNFISLTPTFCAWGSGSIDQGIGSVTSGNPYFLTPPSNTTTTYTLTVNNGAGSSVTATVSVTAVPAPSISSFTIDNSTRTNGQTTVLRYTFSNGSGSINQGVGTVSSGGSSTVTPANSTTTTYTLTVTNLAGSTTTASVSCTTYAAPSISAFTIDSNCYLSPGSTTLRYTFSNGTGSINQGVGSVTSGGNTVVNPSSEGNYTYTLTVTNGAGSTTTAQVTLTVTGYAGAGLDVYIEPGVALCSGTYYVLNGHTFQLHPTYNNSPGTSGRIDQGIGAVSSGSYYTRSQTANTTVTYTLTASNCANSSTASVTVITSNSSPC